MYQNRNIYYQQGYTDNVFKRQLLDKIHCCYQHSYDMGNMFSIKDKKRINEMKEDYIFDNCMPINYDILNMRKILTERVQLRGSRYSKYNTLSQTICNKNTQGKYNFGITFQYKDDHKDNYVLEHDSRDLLVEPIYQDFKEELTQNKMSHVSIMQYKNENKKALIHFESEFCKKQYSKIRVEYILSIMIYCNFDELQNEFSKTYWENVDDHEYFYY
eukprot:386271_1